MKYSVMVTAALFVAGCAGSSATSAAPTPAPAPVKAAPPPPPPVVPTVTPIPPMATIDPAGTYQLQVTFGGQTTGVTMELLHGATGWRGTIGNGSIGSVNVTNVVVTGNRFRVSMTAPQNGTSFSANFELNPDNSVKGNWEGNGDGSPVTGKKIR